MNTGSLSACVNSSPRSNVPSCVLYMLYIRRCWFLRVSLTAITSTPSPQWMGLSIEVTGSVVFVRIMRPLCPSSVLGVLCILYPGNVKGVCWCRSVSCSNIMSALSVFAVACKYAFLFLTLLMFHWRSWMVFRELVCCEVCCEGGRDG